MSDLGARRIVLAPNAFKGSFSAVAVAAIWREALAGRPDVEPDTRPLSDGGDGFVEVVRRYHPEALEVMARARDPLGRPLGAAWAWDPGEDAAWVESAAAIGLDRLAPGERDPLRADSRGLAPLLSTAAGLGSGEITVGLGGSATVDGGWGMARALGFRFEVEGGAEVGRPADLARLERIRPPEVPPLPDEGRVTALADVRSPLLGPRGAAAVFGPQKGADAAAVRVLEEGLARMAERWAADLGAPVELAARPGAGAAGGLGAGLVAFLGARLEDGPRWVANLAGLDAALKRADGVVTGEGRFDAQSAGEKATGEVIARARAQGLPAAVVCAEAAHVPADAGVAVLDARDLGRPAGSPLDAGGLAELAILAAERLAGLQAGN